MQKKIEVSPERLKELVRAEQREYKSVWRQKNKDKVRAANKRYWEKRALKRLEEGKREGANI